MSILFQGLSSTSWHGSTLYGLTPCLPRSHSSSRSNRFTFLSSWGHLQTLRSARINQVPVAPTEERKCAGKLKAGFRWSWTSPYLSLPRLVLAATNRQAWAQSQMHHVGKELRAVHETAIKQQLMIYCQSMAIVYCTGLAWSCSWLHCPGGEEDNSKAGIV